MNNAKQLLSAYLESIRDPRAAAALFADDGVLELPNLKSLGIDGRAQGPKAIDCDVGHPSVPGIGSAVVPRYARER